MARRFMPVAGDIVWLELSQQAEHKEAVHRPVLRCRGFLHELILRPRGIQHSALPAENTYKGKREQ